MKNYTACALMQNNKEKKISYHPKLNSYVDKILLNEDYEKCLYFPFINGEINEKEFKKLLSIFFLKHNEKTEIILIDKNQGRIYL